MATDTARESITTSNSADEGNNEVGYFECNICFDFAQDPIVTLCGHLYCWPCLYQWLQVHSYSQECPVCKAIVDEEKLVPIYGRGKTNSDPRSRLISEITIPNRPIGQRPRTAPPVDTRPYLLRNELDPTTSGRFGNLTLSAFLGIIPAIFSLQSSGIHDATVYGTTAGVPYMFPTSFHGGYGHGFYRHPANVEEKRWLIKMFILLLGIVVLSCLMLF